MSKNLKIFLGISYLIILFTFLYFIFTGVEINKLNDFSYYKELQKELSNFISANVITNLIYFFIFAVIWVALLGFGLPLLIISGIMFGQWIGTLVSVISISIVVYKLLKTINVQMVKCSNECCCAPQLARNQIESPSRHGRAASSLPDEPTKLSCSSCSWQLSSSRNFNNNDGTFADENHKNIYTIHNTPGGWGKINSPLYQKKTH